MLRHCPLSIYIESIFLRLAFQLGRHIASDEYHAIIAGLVEYAVTFRIECAESRHTLPPRIYAFGLRRHRAGCHRRHVIGYIAATGRLYFTSAAAILQNIGLHHYAINILALRHAIMPLR